MIFQNNCQFVLIITSLWFHTFFLHVWQRSHANFIYKSGENKASSAKPFLRRLILHLELAQVVSQYGRQLKDTEKDRDQI